MLTQTSAILYACGIPTQITHLVRKHVCVCIRAVMRPAFIVVVLVQCLLYRLAAIVFQAAHLRNAILTAVVSTFTGWAPDPT